MPNPRLTCSECDYNLPHHGPSCSAAAPLSYRCPAHAPQRPAANDDAMTLRPCGICGAPTRKAYR